MVQEGWKPAMGKLDDIAHAQKDRAIKIANNLYKRYGIRTMSGIDDAWDATTIKPKAVIKEIAETGEKYLKSLFD